MRRSTPRCAVIEFNAYHDEVLPTLVYLLNELGIEPDVYRVAEAARNDAFGYAATLRFRAFSLEGYRTRRWQTRFRLRRYDLLAINSVEPKAIIRRLGASNTPMVGILHNARLIVEDPEYRAFFASPDREAVVLSPHIAAYLRGHAISVPWFTHVYLGDVPRQEKAPDAATTFAVPGNLEASRRNYVSLLDAIGDLAATGAKFGVRMVGRTFTADGVAFRSQLAQRGLAATVTFPTGALTHPQYLAALATTDFILPLVDRSAAPCADYYESKVSSAVPFGVGLALPFVAESEFAGRYGVGRANVGYETGGLADAMARAIALPPPARAAMTAALDEIRVRQLADSVGQLETAITHVLRRGATQGARGILRTR